jgi:glyoxylase-like metal-dependent hydrolase (beta-lactamase superfamily II)/rhodanese-related sulfurtransferase
MHINRFYLPALAHASYIVADEVSRTAVVVDPQRDVDQYLAYAQDNNLEIQQCFLTHFHADFASGHLELKAKTGCSIHLGCRANADYEFEAMPDGATVSVGAMRLSTMETPGHTPESISILLYDLSSDKKAPTAVLTGDTLFIGDVGRPDLSASPLLSVDTMARQLYHSLKSKLLKLPDDTIVYPAHGAGSVCGKYLSDKPQSTIGEQRLTNCALKADSLEEFVRWVTTDQSYVPNYFPYNSQFNRMQHAHLDQILSKAHVPLGLEEVLELQKRGCEILDGRPPDDFATGHIAGSINIPINGRFPHWAGSLISPQAEVVIVANAGQEREAMLMLGRIGYDAIRGFLKPEISSLSASYYRRGAVERISADQLGAHLRESKQLVILDVREEHEAAVFRIEGSLNVPLHNLQEKLKTLPKDCPIVVHCASGQRSSIASSLLLKNNISGFKELLGGIQAYQKTN